MFALKSFFLCVNKVTYKLESKKTHPLKVEKVFFEGLSGLSLLALVDYIRVFFVAATLIVLAAVSLPVTKTHPAEVLKENERHYHIVY